jgi:glycosyltransferase involved in cell wall biosynthesis
VRRKASQVLRRAARLTTVSRFLAEDIRRLLPSLDIDVAVTPMPVDVASFVAGAAEPKAVPPRVLYAGNLVPSKGVDLLLQAAAALSRRGVNYQLKILGQGPAQSSLQTLAQRLGLAQHITWAPFVSQAQMPREYGASTVTVLPSRGSAEGLGLTLVEALLAGSAVVGTPAGGIPEIIRHEETGLLSRGDDPSHLADQIQRLLVDAPLRDRLSRAGREHVLQTYSPESSIGRFLELYDTVAYNNSNR